MKYYCSECGKQMEEYEYKRSDKCIFCKEKEYDNLGIDKGNGNIKRGNT